MKLSKLQAVPKQRVLKKDSQNLEVKTVNSNLRRKKVIASFSVNPLDHISSATGQKIVIRITERRRYPMYSSASSLTAAETES